MHYGYLLTFILLCGFLPHSVLSWSDLTSDPSSKHCTFSLRRVFVTLPFLTFLCGFDVPCSLFPQSMASHTHAHIHTQRPVPLGVARRGAHVLAMTHLHQTILSPATTDSIAPQLFGLVDTYCLTQTHKLSHIHKILNV